MIVFVVSLWSRRLPYLRVCPVFRCVSLSPQVIHEVHCMIIVIIVIVLLMFYKVINPSVI